MRSAVPLIRDIPGRRPGRPPGRRPGHALAAAARAAAGALASRRTYRDLLFCLISVPLAVAGFVVTVSLLIPGGVAAGSVAGIALGVTLIILALRFARQAGRLHRRLAGRVLGLRIAEPARALAVDDSAARLRRVERDLHDGAQARLAALAMSLGLAREKLGAAGQPGDLASARELIGAAHDGAKTAGARENHVAGWQADKGLIKDLWPWRERAARVHRELVSGGGRPQPDRPAERALRSVDGPEFTRPGLDLAIESKLHAPGIRREWVQRPRLLEELAGAASAKLVLVDAPAGFGKTTLVAQWRSSPIERRKFAWVSLDSGDDDPGRLWWHVVSALDRACPELDVRRPPPGAADAGPGHRRRRDPRPGQPAGRAPGPGDPGAGRLSRDQGTQLS